MEATNFGGCDTVLCYHPANSLQRSNRTEHGGTLLTTGSSSLALQDKFDQLETVLNTETVERHREIRAAINALLGRRHASLLGSPGIGKSYLIDLLLDYISGAEGFSVLMTRFTTPPEVFGPVSLAGLEHDRFVRKIDGYLPTAHIA